MGRWQDRCAGFKDIVKLNVYLVDIQANIGVFRAARDEILKGFLLS